jgi:hypothetical protein
MYLLDRILTYESRIRKDENQDFQLVTRFFKILNTSFDHASESSLNSFPLGDDLNQFARFPLAAYWM